MQESRKYFRVPGPGFRAKSITHMETTAFVYWPSHYTDAGVRASRRLFGGWGSGSGVSGLEFGVQGVGFGFWRLAFRIKRLGFLISTKVPSAALRAFRWGLGCQVWGLGCLVQGSGLIFNHAPAGCSRNYIVDRRVGRGAPFAQVNLKPEARNPKPETSKTQSPEPET